MAQLQEREERHSEGLSYPGGPGRREGAGGRSRNVVSALQLPGRGGRGPGTRGGGWEQTAPAGTPPSDHECGTLGRCLGPRPFCIMGHVGFAWGLLWSLLLSQVWCHFLGLEGCQVGGETEGHTGVRRGSGSGCGVPQHSLRKKYSCWWL